MHSTESNHIIRLLLFFWLLLLLLFFQFYDDFRWMKSKVKMLIRSRSFWATLFYRCLSVWVDDAQRVNESAQKCVTCDDDLPLGRCWATTLKQAQRGKIPTTTTSTTVRLCSVWVESIQFHRSEERYCKYWNNVWGGNGRWQMDDKKVIDFFAPINLLCAFLLTIFFCDFTNEIMSKTIVGAPTWKKNCYYGTAAIKIDKRLVSTITFWGVSLFLWKSKWR